MTRQYSPACYNAIKTATKLVLADVGGIDAAATCTRVGKSQLSDYGNVAAAEKFVPVDVVADLERIGGTPHITAALARMQGYTLVLTETPRRHSELAVLMAEIGRDVGELFATTATVLTHGKPTDAEREELLRELDNLHRVTGQVVAFLRRDS